MGHYQVKEIGWSKREVVGNGSEHGWKGDLCGLELHDKELGLDALRNEPCKAFR